MPSQGRRARRALGLLGRIVFVAAGLFVFALGIVLTLQSGLGLGPWTVLSQGLARISGGWLSFGMATNVVGLLVVAVAWGLGIRPALGTVLNMLLVGLYADAILALGLVPDLAGAGLEPATLAARLAMNVGGVVVVGLATAIYIKGGLGAGPRDGLMLGLSQRLGRPIAPVRTALEVGVLLLGILLGGTAGLGTLIWAVGIGPTIAVCFRLLRVRPPVVRERARPLAAPDAPA